MYSLLNNTTGNNNTANGVNAGRYIADGSPKTTGNNGVYLGYDTRASVDGTDNEIVIGASATGNGSNTVTLGNTSVTKTYMSPVIILKSSATAPTGVIGGIYYNSTDNHFYGYNGTWKQLDN